MAHTGGFYKQTKKNINMKQLLSLFLFLLPCLAWAQYPSNGNQKITLGEQTTADGLIYRGVASIDTVTATSKITRANKQDTSAFILLDTTTNLLWHYKTASNGWIQAGGGTAVTTFSGGTTGLTPSTATSGAVTLGGTLAVANGGTGSATQNFVDLTNDQTANGVKTFPNKISVGGSTGVSLLANPAANGYGGFWHNSVTPASTNYAMQTNGATVLINGSTAVTIAQGGSGKISARSFGADVVGDFGIDINPPEEKLDVNGNARIRAVGAGAFSNNLNITSNGTLTTATSDEKFKYNINPIKYGLLTILQLNPVNFQWIEGEEKDLGFIAQDVSEIIPEAVNTNWNSDLLFRYESLIPILTKAIQEQQALIKALEQRIINLENK
jgi:hypothetical protein